MTESAEISRRRGSISNWLRRGAICLIAPVVLLSAGFAVLYTPTGQEWAGGLAGRALGDAGLGKVTIERLAIDSPSRLRLIDVSVADRTGPWSTAPEIAVVWRPFSLIHGEVVIENVTAPRIDILRRPVMEPARQSTAAPHIPRPPQGLHAVAIDELAVHAPVVGMDARFRIRYLALAGGGASLAINRLDRTTDGVEVVVAPDSGNDRLELRVRGREDPDGIVARYFGLPSALPLVLELDGDGKLDDWRGRLRAASGESVLVDAGMGLQVHSPSEITLLAKGRIGAAAMPALAVPPSLRSPVDFDADLRWREAKNEIRVERLKLAHAAGSFDVAGRVIADDAMIEADVSGIVRGGNWLRSLAGPEIGFETAKIEGAIDGRFHAPTVRAKSTLSRLTAPGFSAATAIVSASLANDGSGGGRLKADLALDGAAYGSPVATALLGSGATLGADANVDFRRSRLSVDEARFRSGPTQIAVTGGEYDFAAGSARLNLTASVADLTRVQAASALVNGGAIQSRGAITLEGETVRGKVSIGAAGLSLRNPSVQSIIGPRPAIDAVVERGPGGTVSFRDVRLRAATFRASGEAALELQEGRVSSELVLEAADLARLTTPLGATVGGRATMKVSASGKLSDPGVTAKLNAADVMYRGLKLGRAGMEITAESVITAPSGTLSAWSEPPEGRMTAAVRFAKVGDGTLQLREISLQALGARVTGSLDVPRSGGSFEGALSAAIPDLAALSPVLPTPLEGAVTAQALFGQDGRRQTAKFQLRGEKIGTGSGIGAASLNCAGTVLELVTDRRVQASCTAGDLRLRGWHSKEMTFALTGPLSKASVRLTSAGDEPVMHRLEAAGEIDYRDRGIVIQLRDLSGELDRRNVALQAPSRLALGPKTLSLASTRIRIGQGEVAFQGDAAGNSVSGSLVLSAVELSDYARILGRSEVAGRIDGKLSLRGTLPDPILEFDIGLAGLTFETRGESEKPTFDGTLTGKIANGSAAADANFSGAKTALHARGEVPVTFSLSPFALRAPDNEPIRASARLRGMLSPLAEAFPIPGHRIAGEASASLDVGGTLGRPVVKGTMSIRDGRYENLFTGMVLSNVTLDGEGSDERIQLRLHAGGAGKSDRLEGSGAIVLDRDKGFPLNLALSISELAAVRRDDLSAVVSGRLSLEDSLEKPLLRGEIETRRVDLRIGEPLPPSVVEVEVTEVGGNDNEKPPTGPNSGTPKGDLRLDVAVRIPGGAYIRGRGLDSEWRGTLGVRGSVRNPSVTGALEHVRGQFEFAGKVFKLVRGSITFAQGDEIDPAIDLRAEHTVKSLKAAVDATGTVSRPVVALSSVPQMPRDEILSRILFGKGVGQLTQLETAQLAVAIASVTGLDGGGLGLIDRLRRNVGVDVLRVGSDTAGAPTAVVGKNISDEVYVGVEQGTAANSGKVQVELEVLPGLKLKSGVAAEAQGSLGIEFRWDY